MTTSSDFTLTFTGRWTLVRTDELTSSTAPHITTRELDEGKADSEEVGQHVEQVMKALESLVQEPVTTPGGASWLYVHQVPVRRLVSQVVRKLLALSAWSPFAARPGSIATMPGQALIGERDSSAQEYRSYTVTWPGIAYLLGAEGSPAPVGLMPSFTYARGGGSISPRAAVVALSWSSRHAQTLLPVLTEVSRRGQRSLLLDLATDPTQRCPEPENPLITVCRIPEPHLLASGGVPRTSSEANSGFVMVGAHLILLDRLVDLVACLLEHSAGSTQPSWCATVNVEAWLDGILATARPVTVLVGNDTSPLGALAVHAADRIGARTVYVQHGAWVSGAVAWPALHCRHTVVMGERDAALAANWVRRADAEIHVLGQPRFDALTLVDRPSQRRYLERLLTPEGGRAPERIAVWACQPFSWDRLHAQAETLLRGMRAVREEWGLVIAPHPAQDPRALDFLSERTEALRTAVTDAETGARGCLAGADAVVTVSSTCGIEAMLLNVPVLELHLPGERTLGLAEYQAAHACTDAVDIAATLSHLAESPHRTPVSDRAKNAVCRWTGTTAVAIAELALSPSS
ncbi:hypothetical protein ACFQ08_00210 [Streptosporangium algeriense]|uniref:CDP-Glycerol:Poly(Glycerophosphate) glycerophosphotransferase n=1 Tax=Streptosporangium algeriense TaxID=1682748 RepID=A0ABW3DGI0_9ACTN